MFSLEFGGKFPWIRRHICWMADVKNWQKHKAWVWLPDGRKGVIDHLKTDGNLGVRPIYDNGTYFPNTSAHWTDEQRMQIPEEIATPASALRPVLDREIPAAFLKGIHE